MFGPKYKSKDGYTSRGPLNGSHIYIRTRGKLRRRRVFKTFRKQLLQTYSMVFNFKREDTLTALLLTHDSGAPILEPDSTIQSFSALSRAN